MEEEERRHKWKRREGAKEELEEQRREGKWKRRGREEGMKKGYMEMCEKKWEEEKGVRGG